MQKIIKTIFGGLGILLLVLMAGSIALFGLLSIKNFKDSNKQINILETRLDSLEKILKEEVGKAPLVQEEIVRREVVKQKSQEELLTAAVAKVAPAVVSIVITKDVPKLEIVYGNPFGDDPYFKDFNIQVPMYRQKGTEKQEVGAGTGFLVSNNGYIITNRHVAEDTSATYTVLLNDGSQRAAAVIYRDANLDIAVIKISGSSYSKIDLGSSSSLKLGQSVFAVGNALGEYNNSVSVGIISGLNRDIQASGGGSTESLTGVIQTDAAINPGNSGGPLVNLDGQVVGINVATVLGSQSIGFSIPIDSVKGIINSVVK
ncbi:MAG: trypsin-like peptidase domain-containing protein [Candidatus Pacebacteria bacterium]|nr:trypsin-like peptidase domain-containing protein [Candidatus Paceibacterota bacterium]